MVHHPYKIGMHLKSSRLFYSHHGIYIGDDKVIHYSGFSSIFKMSGEVCITTLAEFCESDFENIEIIYHDSPKFTAEEVVERAKSRLKENEYSLFFNNCERFVNYCIDGEVSSSQVKYAVVSAITIFAGIGTAYMIKRNHDKI